MSIQAPPNLQPGKTEDIFNAGINDFGGISPVTPDHVNPEAPWPQLKLFAEEISAGGKSLVERLAVYPEFIGSREEWIALKFRRTLMTSVDTASLPRTDTWVPGGNQTIPTADFACLTAPHVATIGSDISLY